MSVPDIIFFTTLIRIASANRLAAANPLAPRHRHGHFDSSFQILHPSYVSPTYSGKVSRLTSGTNVAFAQLQKFDAGTTTTKERTLVVSFCQKNSELSVISEKSAFFHRLISIFPIACEWRSSCTMHELNTSRMLKILVMFALSGRNLIIVESLLA